MSISFNDKRIVITGATGGIGGAIADFFIKNGAKCLLSGTNDQKLEALRANYAEKHVEIKKCNLASSEEIKSLIDFANEKLGGIDVLICNAGITKDGLLIQMKEEDFDSVIDVNLKSAFLMTKAAIRGMLKQKSGRIIYITSVVGQTGNPGQANYVSSKAGLIGLCKTIAQEVASRGITVNCVAPGFIASPMTDILTDDQKATITAKIPFGKYGQPSDIANAVAFLASEMASYITGQVIGVNGGMYM